uniref:ARAD1B05456p n=1 Tax=Blastobotrys adeninivorans TaxID=409370 RepID=A0A060TB48_BLAAD
MEKHAKYFRRNLTAFPSAYTSYDSSLTSLAYFCLCGLELVDQKVDNREDCIRWIYSLLVPSGEGFRGSRSHELPVSENSRTYDPPSIASTFFCISMLAAMGDESMTQKLDRAKIMKFVVSCQKDNGAFCALSDPNLGPIGDNDLRHAYMAAAIRHMLQWDTKGSEGCEGPDMDIEKAVSYVLSTRHVNGGFGDSPGAEAHSGLTFCGLSLLTLVGRLDVTDKAWEPTIEYLSKRQDDETGGFNGRVNKPVDTCYAWWNAACLKMLNRANLIDWQGIDRYLETTEHKVLGGYSKTAGGYPDPLHSYLGLAAKALKNDTVVACLSLPQPGMAHLQRLNWNI